MNPAVDWDDRQYWSRHFGMGIAMSIVLPAIVLARTYLRTDIPVDARAVALSASFLASVPALLLLARRILSGKHLHAFFYAWDFLGVAGLTTIVALDGGGSSPYSAFYYVLVGHAALTFPPRATVIFGSLVVLVRLALGLFDSRESVMETLIQVIVLALLAVVSTFMARGQQVLVDRARRLTDEAVRIADIDGLTGCVNHRAFHARLVEQAAKASSANPISVLVLDIDHFKAINDGYGHLAGDGVLARLGALLRANSRAQDVVGRVGGDEFAVLLVDAGHEAAAELERRLLDHLAQGALPYGGRVTIGSASSSKAVHANTLLAAADARLYEERRRDRQEDSQMSPASTTGKPRKRAIPKSRTV